MSTKSVSMRSTRWHSRTYAIAGLAIALILVIILAVTIGSIEISFLTTCKILVSKLPLVNIIPTWSNSIEMVILDIRLPRVLLAGIVGAALATAGATYQGLFRNPLADPYLIGVAQGAALGAVIGFLLPVTVPFLEIGIVPVLAFVGALVATIIVYVLSRTGKTLPVTTLILAGVALGALLWAMVSYLIISSGESMHGIVFWLMGSFSLAKWTSVELVFPCVFVGVGIILLYSRQLNIMQLDEEQAQQLGINIERMKLILLAAATLITAAAVAFVGIIGFIGIIIPHAMRLIWGGDYRFLLPFSILTGAIFLILADLIARAAQSPTEIPIGVITAFCGVPFFLYLLRRRKKFIF
jgi:iron complex transport system permease protein